MRYSGCQTMMHSATSAHMAAQPADSGFLPASVTTEMNAPSPVALRVVLPHWITSAAMALFRAAGGGDDARHDVGENCRQHVVAPPARRSLKVSLTSVICVGMAETPAITLNNTYHWVPSMIIGMAHQPRS